MNPNEIGAELNRRQFLTRATGTVAGVVAATALNPLIGLAQTNQPAAVSAAPKRKIKLGQIGLGGRGSWVPGFFFKKWGVLLTPPGGFFFLGVPRPGGPATRRRGRAVFVPSWLPTGG